MKNELVSLESKELSATPKLPSNQRRRPASNDILSPQFWKEVGEMYVAFVGEKKAKGKQIIVSCGDRIDQNARFDFHGEADKKPRAPTCIAPNPLKLK